MYTFNESKDASEVFNQGNIEGLMQYEPPLATGRHKPIAFFDIAQKTQHYLTREITYRDNDNTLQWGRFAVDNAKWRVNNGELYGDIAMKVYDKNGTDLNPLSSESIWSLGVRSSYMKKTSLKFMFALRMLCCLNGCTVTQHDDSVKHKHTKNVNLDMLINSGLEGMIPNLKSSADIIQTYKETELVDGDAEKILIQAGRNNTIAWSDIGKVDTLYNKPNYEEYKPRNAWSLYNAFTEVARDYNSIEKQHKTLTKLSGLPWAFSRSGVIDLKKVAPSAQYA